ncbi:MAG: hypothetical protein E6Q56_04285 [Mycobacterium sp.]|nr:MAG: hypothetical protein E6Q56_04285 [Mycobacterium sp.]HPZ93916.1 hypothetical protein [Mycobacterium sp.]HQE14318.1 hypothetical protein [Mycobacterium sp.]
MSYRGRLPAVLAGAAGLGALVAFAGPAGAEPVDPFVVPAPPPPVVTYPVAPVANGAAMTPRQQTVPPAGPAAAPPVLSEGGIPEIQNPVYGSGNNGGGIFGTLKDLWDQVKNPAFVPDEIMGGPAAIPGAPAPGPAEAGAPAARPALPPGYYPLDGPPPPGYEYLTPGAVLPTPPPTPQPTP